jgi:hypothetical protein
MLLLPSEPQSTGASVVSGGAPPGASAIPACNRPSKFQILDESDAEEEEPRDWVDADAIFTSEPHARELPPAAPLPAGVTLPAHATSFPLLDDEGNEMVGHQMLPVQLPAVFAESSAEFGYPLGPLIWEPETEESSLICMEPEDDFLWFGSSKAALPPPSELAREIVVPMSRVIAPPAITRPAMPASGGIRWSPDPVPSAPLQLTESPPPESMASILESLRVEAALKGDLAAAGVPSSDPSSASLPALRGHPAAQEPLSFADWMLSTQLPQTGTALSPPTPAAQASAPLRTSLPAPRKSGEFPRFDADSPPVASPAHRPSIAESGLPQQPALVYHRSVAPMAPVHQDEGSDGTRPIPPILATLILTVTLLAMAIWGNGYRTQKDTPPAPWTQEPVTAKERSTAAAVPNP